MMIDGVLMLLAEVGEDAAEGGWDNFRYILLIIGLGMIAFFALARTRRRVARSQAKSSLSAQERVTQARGSHEVSDRIGELMAELADLARQINGELDTRTARLELLLREADRKIAVLKQTSVSVSTKMAALEASGSPGDEGGDGDEAGEMAGAEDQGAENRDYPLPDTPGNRQVIELIEQGLSGSEIAERLGRPMGEIELIMALRGKKI